ncbi:MAG: hypothetical protein ACETWK_08825 [Candidatus Aminicenantaceae bacterium]
MPKFWDFKDEITFTPRAEGREVFVGRCLNCKRKLRIVIDNDATEWWAGICKCGYRNIWDLNEPEECYQRIERVKD